LAPYHLTLPAPLSNLLPLSCRALLSFYACLIPQGWWTAGKYMHLTDVSCVGGIRGNSRVKTISGCALQPSTTGRLIGPIITPARWVRVGKPSTLAGSPRRFAASTRSAPCHCAVALRLHSMPPLLARKPSVFLGSHTRPSGVLKKTPAYYYS
jgi:hypothetical protein